MPATVECPTTGKETSVSQLARAHGLSYNTVYSRYRYGKRGEDLIAPSQAGRRCAECNYFQRACQSALAKPLRHIASASHVAIDE